MRDLRARALNRSLPAQGIGEPRKHTPVFRSAGKSVVRAMLYAIITAIREKVSLVKLFKKLVQLNDKSVRIPDRAHHDRDGATAVVGRIVNLRRR